MTRANGEPVNAQVAGSTLASSDLASGGLALLERLEASLSQGEPGADDCEALADQLLAIGAGAASARWRSWALLPPVAGTLQRELAEARWLLLGAESAAAALPPQWSELQQRLEGGAPAAELLALVRALPSAAVQPPELEQQWRLEWSRRLQRAGAPQAALALLDPWMPEARRQAPLAQQLAELQRQCGQIQQAELWSRISLRLNPQQPLLWFLLARLLLDQGVLDEALQAAETGLEQAPGHPWGLKLRLNSLAAAGGWHSFDRLVQAGALPADPAFVEALAAQRRRYRRRARLGRGTPAPLGLDERLRLRALLRRHDGPVVVLHGRSGAALQWLQQQGVWGELPELQPCGSRDPLRLAAQLTAAGFVVRPEQPLSALAMLQKPAEQPSAEQRPALLLIERPAGRRLPLPLAALLQQAPLLLAPKGLLRLPQRRLLGQQAGWELFGAADAQP